MLQNTYCNAHYTCPPTWNNKLVHTLAPTSEEYRHISCQIPLPHRTHIAAVIRIQDTDSWHMFSKLVFLFFPLSFILYLVEITKNGSLLSYDLGDLLLKNYSIKRTQKFFNSIQWNDRIMRFTQRLKPNHVRSSCKYFQPSDLSLEFQVLELYVMSSFPMPHSSM